MHGSDGGIRSLISGRYRTKEGVVRIESFSYLSFAMSFHRKADATTIQDCGRPVGRPVGSLALVATAAQARDEPSGAQQSATHTTDY